MPHRPKKRLQRNQDWKNMCIYSILICGVIKYIYIYTYMVYMYLFMHIYMYIVYQPVPFPFFVSCDQCHLSNHQPSPPSKQKSRLRFTSKWSCHRAFSWSLWVSMEGLHRVAQDHSSTFQQTCVFFWLKDSRSVITAPREVYKCMIMLLSLQKVTSPSIGIMISKTYWVMSLKMPSCNLEGWYCKVGRWRYERQMVQHAWKVSCYEFERSTLKLTAL